MLRLSCRSVAPPPLPLRAGGRSGAPIPRDTCRRGAASCWCSAPAAETCSPDPVIETHKIIINTNFNNPICRFFPFFFFTDYTAVFSSNRASRAPGAESREQPCKPIHHKYWRRIKYKFQTGLKINKVAKACIVNQRLGSELVFCCPHHRRL